jgi:Zn-dependent protease with chaperone function
VAFLVGLLALFAAQEYGNTFPGQGDLRALAGYAAVLLAPLALALLARRGVRRRYVLGKQASVEPARLLRASALLSPFAVFVVVGLGDLLDLSWRWAGDGHLLGAVFTGLPLLIAEVPRLCVATQVRAWLEVEAGAEVAGQQWHLPTARDLAPLLRIRLGWLLVIGAPWLMLALALDLLATWRAAFAFVLGTSFALAFAFLALIVVVAMVLPWLLRRLFRVRPLPEPIGGELRRAAAALGFPPNRVFLLSTGLRAVNAMLVGPLRVGRWLCVTDGLLHVLDVEGLRGVVAHEVGHARMGHPGLLVLLAVVLPLMALQPLHLLPVAELTPAWQMVVAVPFALLLWLVVRALAHRFELEADVASVQALGAGPCSRALIAVSQATIAARRSLFGRLSTLHPDESTRLSTMVRYEQDAGFRVRFDGTGRRLRGAIAAAVLVATAAAAWTWRVDWPYQHALWRLHSGDVVGAQVARAAIGEEVPEWWRESWQLSGRELAAAVEIAPAATDWATASAAYRERAFARGLAVLAADGAVAARPWFALALDAAEAGDGDWLLLCQLYELCRAVENEDGAMLEQALAVAERWGWPAAARAAAARALVGGVAGER